jgi:hypothetical protein
MRAIRCQSAVEDAGDFRFTVSLVTAMPAHPDLIDLRLRKPPDPVVFAHMLPWVSQEQPGSRRNTIARHDKPKAAATAAEK